MRWMDQWGAAVVVMLIVAYAAISFAQRSSEGDICYGTNYDDLPPDDIRHRLDWHAFTYYERKEPEYFRHIDTLIDSHNRTAPDSPTWHFHSAPADGIRGTSLRRFIAGVICKPDSEDCRNRNFYFYARVPDEEAAEIVFRGTLLLNPELPSGRVGKHGCLPAEP